MRLSNLTELHPPRIEIWHDEVKNIKNSNDVRLTMMTSPPDPKLGDEICPICKKAKSKHTPEEMLSCSRKLIESKNSEDV